MKLKDGKSKVLTFSYDDGVVQDIRLVDIFNKHGLKGTFNINTGTYTPEEKQHERINRRLRLSEAQELYMNSGHEVAVHTLTHPFLERLPISSVLTEILEDRKNIEKQYHTLARGMAYPFGTYSDEVVEALRTCGVCYARTTRATEKFEWPIEWLLLHPTCHHNHPKLMEFAKRFVESSTRFPMDNWMFYVWGHSYEFDDHNNWEIMEQFADYVSDREDVWYATNIEIYDYVKAYENLQVSVDETMIYNPSAIDVWFMKDAHVHCVKAGQTLCLE